MSIYTYKQILSAAKTITINVKNDYKLGKSAKWSYYLAKAILTPKKNIPKIGVNDAPNPTGTAISRTVSKADYSDIAKRYVKFVEGDKRHKLPNYVSYGGHQISPKLATLVFAKILVSYHKNGELPDTVNINSKAFTKPVETTNEVYNYFVKVFGKFDNTIDGALSKVQDRGYSYYYDDVYSNRQSIDRLKKGQGINCTDSCHVFYNIMQQLIALGKYKKVECLHVMCQSGGHVKLRITMNDGTRIIRDPACVISDNGKGVKCVWCTNTPIAVNPSWFMSNLKR